MALRGDCAITKSLKFSARSSHGFLPFPLLFPLTGFDAGSTKHFLIDQSWRRCSFTKQGKEVYSPELRCFGRSQICSYSRSRQNIPNIQGCEASHPPAISVVPLPARLSTWPRIERLFQTRTLSAKKSGHWPKLTCR